MLYSFDQHQVDKLLAAISSTELSDEQLMSRIQDRDESALDTLQRRHAPLLRTVIGRVLNNESDTDDLVSEVMLEIWRHASNYSDQRGKALGWIVTLARRRAIDRVRKRQAYHRAQERYQLEVSLEPKPTIESGTGEAWTDTSEILAKVLSTLPDPQREALHLAFFRGMSQREIAAHTGSPLGTVKTRMELAIRKMRSALMRMGGAGEWIDSLSHASNESAPTRN